MISRNMRLFRSAAVAWVLAALSVPCDVIREKAYQRRHLIPLDTQPSFTGDQQTHIS